MCMNRFQLVRLKKKTTINKHNRLSFLSILLRVMIFSVTAAFTFQKIDAFGADVVHTTHTQFFDQVC